MAATESSAYCDHLSCCICLGLFSDPVTLPCGHSFCRVCITRQKEVKPWCPQCRASLSAEGPHLPTSLTLKSMADKAREQQRFREEQHEQQGAAQGGELCPEHERPLSLFCLTDQRLACLVCRDEKKHKRHRFTTAEEGGASLRAELNALLLRISNDNVATERLADAQSAEISKTRAKSQKLQDRIGGQFAEMHGFLKKREVQIRETLHEQEQDAVKKMSIVLSAMEEAVNGNGMLMGKVASTLEISDPQKLLKCWTESSNRSVGSDFRPRAKDFQVLNCWTSLGPYESHMMFFVWKEMIQIIQPRAEPLSLKKTSTDLMVSDDGRSLLCRTNPSPSFSLPAGLDQFLPYFGSNTRFGPNMTNPHFSSGNGFGPIMTNPPFSSGNGYVQQLTSPSIVTTAGFGQTRSNLSINPGPGYGQLLRSHPGFSQTRLNPFDQTMAPLPLGSNPFVSAAGFHQPAPTSPHHTFSVNEFQSGEHYWEVDVGHREYWELGIKGGFLKFSDGRYSTCGSNSSTQLVFQGQPRKIGIYLDCSSGRVSFYDADHMTHMDTVCSQGMTAPLTAYFSIRPRNPDPNPITVCWY